VIRRLHAHAQLSRKALLGTPGDSAGPVAEERKGCCCNQSGTWRQGVASRADAIARLIERINTNAMRQR